MPEKNIIVISHERSGTHFLMNAITLNFDYNYGTWNDAPIRVNQDRMCRFIRNVKLGDKVVYKSHHQAYTFMKCFGLLKEKFYIFYVIRDGRDCLVSTWLHFLAYGWLDCSRFSEFLRFSPRSTVLKRFDWYDSIRSSNMVERWVTHVSGWYAYRDQITIIKYEDLHTNFEQVVAKISNVLHKAHNKIITRPTLEHECVQPRKGIIGDYKEYFCKEDLEFFDEIAGPVMKMLGFY